MLLCVVGLVVCCGCIGDEHHHRHFKRGFVSLGESLKSIKEEFGVVVNNILEAGVWEC
ncbi:hypothetical protein Metvu_0285 [Methanocaldococcus vulcanius M7]|uniref:Uncharacterized protein n=1 Tax=Methanocaldococcus vulcanius (strain ATCC 700851 / DSM 12094 / M7) TaxID=579137 RepID=C9RF00_METVM|nr:hypothetical protein [Methanocaldococcus vulcanius]ACX72152.1 hypothetical protein Metvu_0285 [Methanocaldococcus vulcanius M7]